MSTIVDMRWGPNSRGRDAWHDGSPLARGRQGCRVAEFATDSPLLHCRLLLVWTQDELLHAPVQDLGDVDLVLRGTGDLVNPSELLGLLARAAEIAQHLALQAELVHAPGIGIGAVEHLVRSWRDAERPRRAGREA